MRKLFFYILRQIVGPFLLFTLILTLVVWMTQSLRLLDLVINRGQSAAIFAYLTMLMIPSLLVVIAPIAFFGAALYALNKLHNDSELVVMWSAGISRFQLALPVLTASLLVMAICYACSLYLMPLGQRTMKDKVFDIRADIGAAILREGAFTTPSDGLTVFIRELAPGGEIRGILVHDNREPKRPLTYLAESGVLAQTQEGARLIMQNGNIEQGEGGGGRLSVLKFERYVFDLDQYAGPQRASERDTSERYLS
jgi:lipopolysaccharide export system permease protein